MESECGVECGGCLSTFAQAQILAQERTVVGVGAILDNRVGALFGVFRTKVGDALVGNEDVDGVLAVVDVRHQSGRCC